MKIDFVMDVSKNQHVTLHPEQCSGCLLCLQVCPNELFRAGTRPNQAGNLPVQMDYPEFCINCMRCVKICPDQALESPLQPEFNLAGHVFGLSLRWHKWLSPHDR